MGESPIRFVTYPNTRAAASPPVRVRISSMLWIIHRPRPEPRRAPFGRVSLSPEISLPVERGSGRMPGGGDEDGESDRGDRGFSRRVRDRFRAVVQSNIASRSTPRL